MNTVKAYKLWYDGAGMHELLGLSKASMDGKAASQTDRRALAEYMLAKLNYAGSPEAIGMMKHSYGAASYRRFTRQPIEHIHRNCKAEIEAKWSKPMLSDKQADEMILADSIDELMSKIPQLATFEWLI